MKSENKKIAAEGNHIYFYDSIESETALVLNKEIRKLTNSLNANKHHEQIIYLHIYSYGGDLFSAFAVVDTIKSNEIPITTIIEGAAASAAALIAVVGNERHITKNSFMLIHQLSTHQAGSHEKFKDELENQEDLMETVKTIYKEHSSLKVKELTDILKRELWINSKKCQEYGLVDKII